MQNRRQAQNLDAIQKADEEFQVQIEEKSFILKSGEKINFIQVQDLVREEAFWLELQDAVWRVVYPVRALADQSLAQGMSAMVKMATEQKLLKPDGDWDEYGLEKPDTKIGVGTSAGDQRYFLYLGKKSTLGNVVFARWDDSKAYFTLPAAVKDAFRKTVYEVREKRVFMTPLPKIDRVTVALGEKTFEWVLKENEWYWMEPLDLLGKPMAKDQMAAVLQILTRIYVKEFAEDTQKKAADAGVNMIADRIQVRSGEKSETVYLGDEEPLKTAYYAQRENEKNLFLIDQTKILEVLELLDALDKVNHPPVTAGGLPEMAPEKKLELAARTNAA
jgi:hypothetical protein